jgi:nucleotide-binding universal stress UspA family protein
MSTISRILLPVDFSPNSVGAARYAAALADHFHAELTMLHAFASPPSVTPMTWDHVGDIGAVIEEFQKERRRELECFAKDEFAGVNVKRVMVTGDPARTIVEEAEQLHADLIVMSTRGCGTFRRLLFGSVTAKVLHDTTCPVWTGAHLEETSHEEWKAIRNVLCAIDNGPASKKVLKWAACFASEFGAHLTIVHAIPALPPHPYVYVDPNWWNILAAEAREKTAGIMAAADLHHGEIVIEEGEPAKAVHAAAARLGADVVVIGRGLDDGILGRLRANSYAIIRESPCPVVSI